MIELPPDIKACAVSATCVTSTVSGVGIPAIIIILGVLHAVGVRSPDLPILSEFITKEAIAAVAAEEDAEAMIKPDGTAMPPDAEFPNESSPLLERASTENQKPPGWRQFVLTLIPILEIAGWTIGLVHQATSASPGILTVITPAIVVLSWVYAELRPNLRPSCTPYYDLLLLYLSQFVSACVALYEGFVTGAPNSGFFSEHVGRIFDAFLTLGGITIILNMPLESFGKATVDAEGRSPPLEDHCTLLEWITFSWVSPLVALGSPQPLGEKDMWQLSRLMRTRVLMKQFSQLKRSSLLRKILVANGRDMFLDLVLTVLSSILSFGPPVFLNLILRALTADHSVDSSSPSFNLDDLRLYTSLSVNALLLQPSDSTATKTRPLERRDAYVFAVAAAICQLIKSQSDLQHLYFARRASVRIKGELVASIYEKALKRKDLSGAVKKPDLKAKSEPGADSSAPQEESSSADIGKVVSLIAADAEWIARFVTLGTFIYDGPVSAVISCVLLYNFMGWTAFVGYMALVLTLPVNHLLVQRTAIYQRSVSAMRDRRMQAMNEAIQGIKFIKFSAWESRWIQRVLEARHAEVGWLSKLKLTNFFMSMVWDLIPILVATIGFTCFTLVAKRELTVDIAFPCLSIFHLFSSSLVILPLTVASIVRTLVSLQRIEGYLSEEEVPEHVSSLKRPSPTPHGPTETRLGCNNATFRWPTISAVNKKTSQALKTQQPSRWTKLLTTLHLRKKVAAPLESQEDTVTEEDQPFTLRDISVVFPEGVLSLVYGPTGSGKSSLLSAVLGEMDRIAGESYLPKDSTYLNAKTGLKMAISYCAQQPWLEHKSIKDNILFGSPFDAERYRATLDACALRPDLALFDDGDETEIGEKGVSLSGGQKARVALARAVYARTQFVIVDDVLSAVDSHTAEHIVQRCIRGPLLKNRTVVLVTHHVDLVLPVAGWLVQVNGGYIDAQGTPQQLRESGALLRAKEIGSQKFAAEVTDEKDEPTVETTEKKPAKKLVEDEAQSTGSVRAEVYKTYLSAASYWLFGILVLLLALDQAVQLMQKFWIKHWGESYETEAQNLIVTRSWFDFGFPSASRNVVPYLAVYLIIQTSSSVISVLSQIPDIWATLRASRILYEKMLHSVMRSPSRLFDRTPSGRILNRFSKDIDMIDSGIQTFMVSVLTQVLILLVAVGTIVYAVPYFIFPAVLIAYLHVWFSGGYVSASRDLRRIEATTRSPIVASFSELLTGIVTVRAFGAERAFLLNMYKRLDLTQTATHYFWMCNRWLLLRFDFLGAFSILIATIGTIKGGASAGLTGIVITQAQQYVRSLYFGLRFWTELEQSMNSVERIKEYLDLPSEPPAVIPGNRPPAYWPSSTTGSLVVEDLSVKYAADLEPVLKGVSFAIRPSEKVGVVGRTGSGKSTLAMALFRFTDPASGKIVLDGIDITSIGLDDLRSKLTLIPQDAVLFKGTIRDNLDPFKDHTDAECIEALKRVHLPVGNGESQPSTTSEPISDMTTAPDSEAQTETSSLVTKIGGSKLVTLTLETAVSEGGNNFSHGQRQLLSMARALLRKSNVIVMDEPTASVDFETDAKIQATIRDEFKKSMLITIAHRLRTVIDNDRILVLNAGRVVEFDTPKRLLEKPNGVFREMCKKSGDYEHLINTLQVAPK